MLLTVGRWQINVAPRDGHGGLTLRCSPTWVLTGEILVNLDFEVQL